MFHFPFAAVGGPNSLLFYSNNLCINPTKSVYLCFSLTPALMSYKSHRKYAPAFLTVALTAQFVLCLRIEYHQGSDKLEQHKGPFLPLPLLAFLPLKLTAIYLVTVSSFTLYIYQVIQNIFPYALLLSSVTFFLKPSYYCIQILLLLETEVQDMWVITMRMFITALFQEAKNLKW